MPAELKQTALAILYMSPCIKVTYARFQLVTRFTVMVPLQALQVLVLISKSCPPNQAFLYCVCAQAANISKERLAGFDRPIVSEPKFSEAQSSGLKRDLTAYLQTLKASLLQLVL